MPVLMLFIIPFINAGDSLGRFYKPIGIKPSGRSIIGLTRMYGIPLPAQIAKEHCNRMKNMRRETRCCLQGCLGEQYRTR